MGASQCRGKGECLHSLTDQSLKQRNSDFLADIGKKMRIFAENNTDFLPMEKSYISTKEYAEAHGLAERTIRNYCTQGKIPMA